MDFIKQRFSVNFEYKIYFTSGLFNINNVVFDNFLKEKKTNSLQKIFFVIDENVVQAHKNLMAEIIAYFNKFDTVVLAQDILIIPGGEGVKNDLTLFNKIITAVNNYKLDRHSYLAAIGGGAILDVAGYAAAVAHRGIRHIRIPTTTLSQNDSGIGVKNGVNYLNKKNFLGTFATPLAVFNDELFLLSQDERNWRSGISEAIKVALIKDAVFFNWIKNNTPQLVARNLNTMNYLVKRCAELHLQHIAGDDPFETGSSRPLDFGHWSAHKLEQLTNFEVLHGEAVAMGIALDSMYSALSGRLSMQKAESVIEVLKALGFKITHPFMQIETDNNLLNGLDEFREHLGGQLTIMLLCDIGKGIEVHEMDTEILAKSAKQLKALAGVQTV